MSTATDTASAPRVDVRGPRFTGRVTTGVVVVALLLPAVGLITTAFTLFAALLNAAFGICLGCTLYPLAARLRRVPAPA